MRKIIFILLFFSIISAEAQQKPFAFAKGKIPDYRTHLIYEWYADSNVTSAGGKRSAWKNTIDTLAARQDAALNKPTIVSNVLNGRSVVRFDGTNSYLYCKDITVTNYTIIIIYKATPPFGATANLILACHNEYIASSVNAVGDGYGCYSVNRRGVAYNANDTTWHIRSFQNAYLYSNGIEASYHSTGTTTAMIITRFARLDTDVYPFKGDIACVRIYNETTTTTNRKTAEDFLNSLYKVY